MNTPRWFFSVPVLAAVALAAAGCRSGSSPEQQRADSTFGVAKEALSRGSLHEAKDLLLALAVLEKDLGRTARLAEILHLLGDGYAMTASYDSAALLYSRATEQYRNLADRHSTWLITLKTGALYRQMDQEGKAFEVYTDALRLARVFKDAEGIRDIAWAMIPCCRALEETVEETRLSDELLKHFQGAHDAGMEARVYLESGISSASRKEYDQAMQKFLRAITVAAQAKETLLTATALMRLGMAYDAAGKITEAFQQYGDALRMAGSSPQNAEFRLELLTRIGNGYLRFRQPTDARRFYQAALRSAIRLHNRLLEGYLTLQLGHCSAASAPEEAAKLYDSALSLFKELGWRDGIAYTLTSMGYLSEQRGQPATAIDRLKESVENLDGVLAPMGEGDLFVDCRRAFFVGSSSYPYEYLLDVLLRTGKHEDAFSYNERRSRSELYRLLRTLEPSVSDAALFGELLQLSRMRAFQIGAERQYRQLLSAGLASQEILHATREQLLMASQGVRIEQERVARLKSSLEPVVHVAGMTMAEAQRHVPPGSLVVAYVPTRRSLYVFLLTAQKASVQLVAVERGVLLRAVDQYMSLFREHEATGDSVQLLQAGRDTRLLEQARVLREWFVRPLEAELRTVSRVTVLASPDFPFFPVQTLRLRSALPSPYLADERLVTHLPIAAALLLPEVAPGKVADVVALGYPGKSSWDVEYELRDIRAFYKEARMYFGEQASIMTLERERADLVHVAAEIRIYEEFPANSCLVLSEGKAPGLHASILLGRLFSLPPSPTLVFSNLKPGITPLHAAVPYILLSNGSGAVLLNGVVPPRKAKKYFSEVFYTSLQGGMTSAEAFHRVQREMIRNVEYSSPYVWGTLFLWGK